MDRSFISGWVRQARHKAKLKGLANDLPLEFLEDLVDQYHHSCAYCGEKASTLDHPFPIKQDGPNVGANVLPICEKCKRKKGTNDIIDFLGQGPKLNKILQEMLSREGGNKLKKYIKKITGLT